MAKGVIVMDSSQAIINLIQLLLGGASLYSLLDDTIVRGLVFMFLLYLVVFIESILANKRAEMYR